MWTRFLDMLSGGPLKEKWLYIYIEAPKKEAISIFYNRFSHNPNRVTCTCCGEDYHIIEGEDFLQASGYDRGCAYEDGKWIDKSGEVCLYPYQTEKEFISRSDILIIKEKDIKSYERNRVVPEQGYIWID